MCSRAGEKPKSGADKDALHAVPIGRDDREGALLRRGPELSVIVPSSVRRL